MSLPLSKKTEILQAVDTILQLVPPRRRSDAAGAVATLEALLPTRDGRRAKPPGFGRKVSEAHRLRRESERFLLECQETRRTETVLGWDALVARTGYAPHSLRCRFSLGQGSFVSKRLRKFPGGVKIIRLDLPR